jgi:hypothetical protein
MADIHTSTRGKKTARRLFGFPRLLLLAVLCLLVLPYSRSRFTKMHRVKERPEREADRSSPQAPTLKMSGALPPYSHISLRCA